MEQIEKSANMESKELQMFRESADVGLRVAEPYKKIIGWLIIGWVSTALILGGLLGFQIYKAYEEPAGYEYSQEQDFGGETQTQSGKGSGN